MESTYTDSALYGGKNVCARTDDGFSPISEVCDGTVSLTNNDATILWRLTTVPLMTKWHGFEN